MADVKEGPIRYDLEADMMPAIVGQVHQLVRGLDHEDDRHVLLEVPAFESIPDIIVVQLNGEAAKRRLQIGLTPITDVTSMRTLLALQAGITALDLLPSHAGVTRAHLRRTVLPALVEGGWVRPFNGRSSVVATRHRLEPMLNWVVTVEAKRSKWRDAVAQARRHQRVADRTFIALDAMSANPARSWARELAAEGIGLVTVDARSDSAKVERRPRRAPKPDAAARHLLGERVWQMLEGGSDCGETLPVFGQRLPMRIAIG